MPTSVHGMALLPIFSDKWFDAAFENCHAALSAKTAAKKITKAYGLKGQADPAYIANIISMEIESAIISTLKAIPPK